MSETRTEVRDLVIRKQTGVAGQIGYRATYVLDGTDPDGTTWQNAGVVGFVGNQSGTPGVVVMVSLEPAGPGKFTERGQMFVTDPGRFGHKFDRSWVERFVKGQPC